MAKVQWFTNTIRVARPGFWSTQLWFYLLPLGTYHLLDQWTFWLGAVYVTFPLGYLLYGWNDVADYETDQHNPRKGTFLFGARLPPHELRKLPLRILIVQLPFAVLFSVASGPRMLAWFLMTAAVNATYNARRLNFKGRPFLDLANQAGYLLVFVLSSWLNEVPQLPPAAFVFGALFAMHSHLVGQMADVEPDLAAGRRTTVVVFGIVPSKCLAATLLLLESGVIQVYFNSPLLALFLAAAGVGFLADAAIRGKRLVTTRQLRMLLLAWNGAALASMYWIWRVGVFAR